MIKLSPQQGVLGFDFPADVLGHGFCVTPAHQQAVNKMGQLAEWRSPFLILLGTAGSGKTALLELWSQATAAQDLSKLDHQERTRFYLDDIDMALLDNPSLQETLFHLYNRSYEEPDLRILLTATQPLAMYQDKILKDLASRLASADTVTIEPPDEESVRLLTMALFEKRQMTVKDEVLTYLVTRLPRDYSQIIAFIDRIDHESLRLKRSVTIPLVKEILE